MRGELRAVMISCAQRRETERPNGADRVDAIATEPHYLEHVLPIFDALPDDVRGDLIVSRDLIPPSKRATIVSSFGDLARARRADRPAILLEHGAGQTYRTPNGELLSHTSYAGGRDRYGVILALVPGPTSRDAYLESRTLNGAPVVAIGAPKLDPWHAGDRRPTLTDPPTIAVSFHWDCRVVPETRSAWRRFLPGVVELARARDLRVLGHAHPRLRRTIEPIYEKHGIPFEPCFDRVLETASVYACDNSSTMFEFASTGRPVVVLNHRIYRKDVEHGLRFWAGSNLGPHVDDPDELEPAVRRALRPSRGAAELRRASVALAYAACDGKATERAVRAILDVVTG